MIIITYNKISNVLGRLYFQERVYFYEYKNKLDKSEKSWEKLKDSNLKDFMWKYFRLSAQCS